MSNVYFMSDLHLGHKSICRFRTQFETPKDHDATIKDNILTSIRKRDTLWLLGDIAFTSEAGDWIVELSKKCNLKIIIGNHDSDSAVRMQNVLKYMNTGIKVQSLVSYRNCWLSHAPIHEQELRSRILNIHGHNHSNNVMYHDSCDGEWYDDRRYFNVSCENIDYKPIKFQDIMEITGNQ